MAIDHKSSNEGRHFKGLKKFSWNILSETTYQLKRYHSLINSKEWSIL